MKVSGKHRMELFSLVCRGLRTGFFLNAAFSFLISAFHLPAALSDFYQNIFMTLSAKHPIACLEQACLGERQEGFEEQMVFKKNFCFFSPGSASVLKQVQVTLLVGFFSWHIINILNSRDLCCLS